MLTPGSRMNRVRRDHHPHHARTQGYGPGRPARPAVASAHSLDIAYLRIEPGASATTSKVTIDLDLAAAALLLDADPTKLDAATLAARAGDLATHSYARDLPTTPRGACSLGAPAVDYAPPSVHLSATLTCPPGVRTWRFPFVTDARIPATFQLLVKETAADRLTVIDKTLAQLALSDAVAAPAVAAPAVAIVRSARDPRMLVVGGVLVVVVLGPLAYLVARRKREE